MDFKTKYITSDIKLSRYEGKSYRTEIAFKQHMLIWFISGETKIVQADTNYLFNAGDIFLIPRNQMATIVGYPKDGLPHQSVVMHLSANRLREFYAGLNIKPKGVATQKIRSFSKHPLLESCLTSLIPYFDMQEIFPENIASLKITEAISVLRAINKDVDDLLADFEEPDRIDLKDFMEKNFMFNIPLEKFSYLTGRSLTTFKRDFHAAFSITPQRWLTQKRLELAHYHLSRQNKSPVEIYYESGFENLSHFSYAFKKHFGYAPTELKLKKIVS